MIRSNRVKVHGTVSFNGKILIRNKGRIDIHNGSIFNNSSEYNPVGLPHPVILATLNNDAAIEIGAGTGISGAAIVAATKISIGKNVLIGGGVGIWDTDFHPLDPEMRKVHQTNGAVSLPIIIEDDVFIGARAIILKGVTIGKGSVIGAGALVTKNVPPYSTAFGNPLIIKQDKAK
jgi:acetyltransferase-like isoleucine patch superfamily enzyme